MRICSQCNREHYRVILEKGTMRQRCKLTEKRTNRYLYCHNWRAAKAEKQ